MINLYYLVTFYTSHKHLVMAMVQTAVHCKQHWHGESRLQHHPGTISGGGHRGHIHCCKSPFCMCLSIYIYIYTGWWFGTWLLFSMIYGMSSFPLTFIFFRGVQTTHQIQMNGHPVIQDSYGTWLIYR